MNKVKNCRDEESGRYDTVGNPVMIRICYCGTTGCKYLPKNDYPLPADFNELHAIDRPCKTCGVPKIYQSINCPNH